MASVASAASGARSKGYPVPRKGFPLSKTIPKPANDNWPAPANDNKPHRQKAKRLSDLTRIPKVSGAVTGIAVREGVGFAIDNLMVIGEYLAAGWQHPGYTEYGQCSGGHYPTGPTFWNHPLNSTPPITAAHCSASRESFSSTKPSASAVAPQTGKSYWEWYNLADYPYRWWRAHKLYTANSPSSVPNPHYQAEQSPRAVPAVAGASGGLPPIGDNPVETSSSSNGTPRRNRAHPRYQRRKRGKKGEVKVNGNGTKAGRVANILVRAAGGAFNLATETKDIVDILVAALPKHLRPKNGGLHVRAKSVLDNLDQIDWNKALPALVANEIEDRIAGRIAGARNRAGNRLIKGPVLRGPGLTPQFRQPNIRW